MKLVRYIANNSTGPAVGILDGDTISEVPGSSGNLETIPLLDKSGLSQLKNASMTQHSLGDVRLLSPIDGSKKLLLLAANYTPVGGKLEKDLSIEEPEFFSKPSTALIADGEIIPDNSLVVNQVEEIELGVIIGKPGKNIKKENAFDHIFGYTVVNDVSGRDLDFSPDRKNPARSGWFDWLNGKWLDGYCAVGPWIIPAEDLKDPTNLKLTTKVNGKERLVSTTKLMIHNIESQIEYISNLCTLETGDLIATGVAAGASDDEIYLNPGDVIEGTVEGVGTLTNTTGK
jgi:2-keto-4-pentenoate hydratase/2-oxohepta-3-ene-1,7-dioic acid hydratase in catechol pathway